MKLETFQRIEKGRFLHQLLEKKKKSILSRYFDHITFITFHFYYFFYTDFFYLSTFKPKINHKSVF